MDARICNYAPVFLLLASLGLTGCDNGRVSPSTDELIGPAPVTASLVTVEPTIVRPEFLSNPFCPTPPSFQARFRLVVRADRELIVGGVRFEFLDRFGGRSVPTSIPTSSPIPISGTSPIPIPGTSPIPIPGTSPIPIPGTSPTPVPGTSQFDGLLMSPGSLHTLPFLLQFDCGVPASGTLFVIVSTTDRRRTADVTRVSVGIVGR